jgi:hypothetical protein
MLAASLDWLIDATTLLNEHIPVSVPDPIAQEVTV